MHGENTLRLHSAWEGWSVHVRTNSSSCTLCTSHATEVKTETTQKQTTTNPKSLQNKQTKLSAQEKAL